MAEDRFTDQHVRELLRRAIDIDAREEDTISESELRAIAQEVGVRPVSMDRALNGLKGELRAAPPPLPRAFRRWGLFGAVVAVGITSLVAVPGALNEFSVPLAVVAVLAGFSALSPKYIQRRRRSTVIGEDGVRYTSRNGERLLPWSSVLQLKAEIPGTIQLVAPTGSMVLFLKDFGDPDAVLALIKSRVTLASLNTRGDTLGAS